MSILGELEQKIMDIVWASKQPLKPADVLDGLKQPLAYTTVMTVMKRLVDKGLLRRVKKGNVFFYSVAKQKKDFAKSKLSKLFATLVDSYGDLAISQFADTIKSNPQDVELLKDYLSKKKHEDKI